MIVTRIHDAAKRPTQPRSGVQTIGSAPFKGIRVSTKEEMHADSLETEHNQVQHNRRGAPDEGYHFKASSYGSQSVTSPLSEVASIPDRTAAREALEKEMP